MFSRVDLWLTEATTTTLGRTTIQSVLQTLNTALTTHAAKDAQQQ